MSKYSERKLKLLCDLKAEINNGVGYMPRKSFLSIGKREDEEQAVRAYIQRISSIVDLLIREETGKDAEIMIMPFRVDAAELFDKLTNGGKR